MTTEIPFLACETAHIDISKDPAHLESLLLNVGKEINAALAEILGEGVVRVRYQNITSTRSINRDGTMPIFRVSAGYAPEGVSMLPPVKMTPQCKEQLRDATSAAA